jgi:hypothetical protein
MDHPAPAVFPDPLQRIGTPITVPHGHKPNPEYQDLLTLYAQVYGAEEDLRTALRPAERTAKDGAWRGPAAQEWTTELDDWSRRLDQAADTIMQELAGRLRTTPPYIPTGIDPGGEMHPGGINPGGEMYPAGLNPGGEMYPGGVNPGGPMHHEPNPGGVMYPAGVEPGGPMRRPPNPGGPYREPDPGGPLYPQDPAY